MPPMDNATRLVLTCPVNLRILHDQDMYLDVRKCQLHFILYHKQKNLLLIAICAGRELNPAGFLDLGSGPRLRGETPRSRDAEGPPKMGPLGRSHSCQGKQDDKRQSVHCVFEAKLLCNDYRVWICALPINRRSCTLSYPLKVVKLSSLTFLYQLGCKHYMKCAIEEGVTEHIEVCWLYHT